MYKDIPGRSRWNLEAPTKYLRKSDPRQIAAAEHLGGTLPFKSDFPDMQALDKRLEEIEKRWDTQFLVHALGFSDKSEPRGKYVGTTLGNSRRGKVVPHYDVIGVAKAALGNQRTIPRQRFGPENIRAQANSAGPL